jgi:hypothetical protein
MPKPIENTERISTFVTPEQLSELKIQAKSKGMTVSGFIRMLIIDGIDTSTVSSNSPTRDSTESVDELFAQLPGKLY